MPGNIIKFPRDIRRICARRKWKKFIQKKKPNRNASPSVGVEERACRGRVIQLDWRRHGRRRWRRNMRIAVGRRFARRSIEIVVEHGRRHRYTATRGECFLFRGSRSGGCRCRFPFARHILLAQQRLQRLILRQQLLLDLQILGHGRLQEGSLHLAVFAAGRCAAKAVGTGAHHQHRIGCVVAVCGAGCLMGGAAAFDGVDQVGFFGEPFQ